jgi:hypothetical protein
MVALGAAAGLLTITDPLTAQIEVGENVQVSKVLAEYAHGEVLLAADPSDPKHLLGCSMVFLSDVNAVSTAVYASTDGGASWSRTLQPREFENSGDPACTFGPGGTAYYVDMSTRSGSDRYLPVYRSSDHGLTWSDPVLIPNRFQGMDREYIVVDNTGGPQRGRVYIHGSGWMRDMSSDRLAGDISVYSSSDGGMTFSGPTKRGSFERRYVLGVGNGAVLSDGTFIAAFGELKDYWSGLSPGKVQPNAEGQSNALLRVLLSRDGGASFEPAVTVGDFYMDWPPYLTSAIPYLAVDPGSEPFRDRLYVVWPDLRSGRLEILLSRSVDGGSTWSPPRRVNDDGPPGDRPEVHQFLPVVAVNREGVVGVMWYDRRDSADGLGWTIRFSASLDGGDTFLPSVPVSAPNTYGGQEEWSLLGRVSVPSDSVAPLTVAVSLTGFHFNGGHTAGMAASAEGVFHPFWIDNRTGVAQVWTARVTVEGRGTLNGSPALAAMRDVSGRVKLHMSDVEIDDGREIVSFRAQLENTSDDVILGPVTVRALEIRSPQARVSTVGGDNGVSGEGTLWRFADAGTRLEPGARTESRTLRFTLSDLLDSHPESLPQGLLNLKLRVLAASVVSQSSAGGG